MEQQNCDDGVKGECEGEGQWTVVVERARRDAQRKEGWGEKGGMDERGNGKVMATQKV